MSNHTRCVEWQKGGDLSISRPRDLLQRARARVRARVRFRLRVRIKFKVRVRCTVGLGVKLALRFDSHSNLLSCFIFIQLSSRGRAQESHTEIIFLRVQYNARLDKARKSTIYINKRLLLTVNIEHYSSDLHIRN